MFGTPRFEDCDVKAGLQERNYGCPLIKNQARANLHLLPRSLLIELPKYLSPDYVSILMNLSAHKLTLILLAPPEAEKKLREVFPGFPVKHPEPPRVVNLLEIYQQRLFDAGITVSPLPPQAVVTLAYMHRGNVRSFLEHIDSLLDCMATEGILETATNEWIGRKIGREIGDELAINLVISFQQSIGKKWISHAEIKKRLRVTFGIRITSTRLGSMLSDMGVEKQRKGKAKVLGYDISDFESMID